MEFQVGNEYIRKIIFLQNCYSRTSLYAMIVHLMCMLELAFEKSLMFPRVGYVFDLCKESLFVNYTYLIIFHPTFPSPKIL